MEYPPGDHQIPLQFQKLPEGELLLKAKDRYAAWAVQD